MTDSWVMQLTKGLATLLNDTGLGTYRETGAYTAAETAIVFGKLPSTPNQIICLTPYGPTDDTTITVVTQMIQIRVRAKTFTDVVNLTEQIRDLLHRHPPVTLGTARVSSIARRSAAYMGVDTNGLHEYSSNFRFIGSRPMQPVGTLNGV